MTIAGLSREQIRATVRRGREYRGEHLVLHVLDVPDDESGVAFVASKRPEGRALDRNRKLRVMRELWAHSGSDARKCSVVMRWLGPVRGTKYSQLVSEIKTLREPLETPE